MGLSTWRNTRLVRKPSRPPPKNRQVWYRQMHDRLWIPVHGIFSASCLDYVTQGFLERQGRWGEHHIQVLKSVTIEFSLFFIDCLGVYECPSSFRPYRGSMLPSSDGHHTRVIRQHHVVLHSWPFLPVQTRASTLAGEGVMRPLPWMMSWKAHQLFAATHATFFFRRDFETHD